MTQTLYQRLTSIDDVTKSLETYDANAKQRVIALSLPPEKESELLALLEPPQQLNTTGHRLIIDQFTKQNQIVREAVLGYVDVSSELSLLEGQVPSYFSPNDHKQMFYKKKNALSELIEVGHLRTNEGQTVPQLIGQASMYLIGSTAVGLAIAKGMPMLLGIENFEHEGLVQNIGALMGVLGGTAMFLAVSYKLEQSRNRAKGMAAYLDSRIREMYHHSK